MDKKVKGKFFLNNPVKKEILSLLKKKNQFSLSAPPFKICH